ncbi:hypothetical protein GCM10023196_056830 [Actinoallomurus vinaceus]|uniref:Uncharacterized protein n=1 Tax=Actinoallomurus vinaceus TaxID=1080074 RepID=A0ABP8UGT6_9ACTN
MRGFHGAWPRSPSSLGTEKSDGIVMNAGQKCPHCRTLSDRHAARDGPGGDQQTNAIITREEHPVKIQ